MDAKRLVQISIDGVTLQVNDGETVLTAALKQNIPVMHLCFDEKLSKNVRCGLCIAHLEGRGLVRLCEIQAEEGQVFSLNRPDLEERRRKRLQQLTDDHRGDCIAPCQNACPVGLDCQAYTALIANAEFDQAIRLIKRSYPFAAALASTCVRPCEHACRRGKLDHAIQLADLEYVVALKDLESDSPYIPEVKTRSGRSVAIVGAGPAGLTAAWLLAINGHDVNVFDAADKPGGLLRTNIAPEKLAPAILEKEIALIEKIGVKLRLSINVGHDLSFAELLEHYDAVLLSTGNQANAQTDVAVIPVDRCDDRSIIADEQSRTSVPGVFACGDATRTRSKAMVEVIAEAQRATAAIEAYFDENDVPFSRRHAYVSQFDVTPDDIRDSLDPYQKQFESEHPAGACDRTLSADALTEWAVSEAKRCLECGCADLYECRLLSYSDRVALSPYTAVSDKQPMEKRYPYIHYEAQKCIACGLCVKACQEIMGNNCLEIVDHGVMSIVGGGSLQEAHCVGCGQCVEHCPTGALTEHNPRLKQLTLPSVKHDGICNYCGVGCATHVCVYDDLIVKVKPRWGGSLEENVLCRHGRFGWEIALSDRSLSTPLIREGDQWIPHNWDSAIAQAATQIEAVQARYGKDAVGLLIADRLTTEEIFLATQLAETIGADHLYSANAYDGGLEDVFGIDGSTNSYRELEETDLIAVIGADVPTYYAMLAVPIRKAVGKGAKLLLAAAEGWNGFNFLAHDRINLTDDTSFLRQVLKHLIDNGTSSLANIEGIDDVKASLSDIEISADAKRFADEYASAKTAMIVFDRERVTAEAARLIAMISVVSGHIGGASNGVIQMLQHSNTQTISLLNIRNNLAALKDDIYAGKIKALILIEQFVPDEWLDRIDFCLLLDSMQTPALQYANIFLPMPGYGAFSGSYISAEGRIQAFTSAVNPPSGLDGYEVLAKLIRAFGGHVSSALSEIREQFTSTYRLFETTDMQSTSFVSGKAVRFADGIYAHEDGQAHLSIPKTGEKMFANMVFADAPLISWFGCLAAEGLVQFT